MSGGKHFKVYFYSLITIKGYILYYLAKQFVEIHYAHNKNSMFEEHEIRDAFLPYISYHVNKNYTLIAIN